MRLQNLESTLQRWEEELSTSPSKTTLTSKDISRLEERIVVIKQVQASLDDLFDRAGQFIEEV